MLFRLLISLVVFIINIGNTSAVFRRSQSPPNNYPYSQPPSAPFAAGLGHLSPNAYSTTHQSSYNAQNQQPQLKIPIPKEDPKFAAATCGIMIYRKEAILAARAEGCRALPMNNPPVGTRKAVEYYPPNLGSLKEKPPLYLYPMVQLRPGRNKDPKYGMERIILTKECQAVGALTEVPGFRQFLKKTGNRLRGKPTTGYDQKRHRYSYCKLYAAPPV